MSANNEQIGKDRRIVNIDGKYVKRRTSKHRRRLEKQLGEDAPKQRFYRGWVA